MNPGPNDLLALDFEENPQSQMTVAQAEQFVTEIFNQTGRYPGFYSGALAGNMLGRQTKLYFGELLVLARAVWCIIAISAADLVHLDHVAVHQFRAGERARCTMRQGYFKWQHGSVVTPVGL